MRLPREISPGAAARRSLLFDTVAALAIFLVAISVAAGIGVVGFVALLAAILLVVWYLVEAVVRRVRRRSGPTGERPRAAGAKEPRAGGEQHHRELQG